MKLACSLLLLTGICTIASATTPTYAIPAYGAQYSESGSETARLLADLLEQQRQTNAHLARMVELLERSGTIQPGVLPVKADASAAFRASCINCHAAAVAERKGAGFVIFDADGSLTKFNRLERTAIKERVLKGEMPPAPAKLSSAGKASILDSIK